MFLDLFVNYHSEITLNTSCPWTSCTLSYGIYIDPLYIGYFFQLPYLSPKKLFVLIPLSSATLVFPFDFVELVLCYLYVGTFDDPICVHFCIQMQNHK
jgi:hypothetical protein